MRSDDADPGRTIGSDGPLSWVFKPSFGIVHQTNCAICRSYMTHVLVAHQAGEPSFKDALSEREVRLSSSFLDGVREGSQLQQEHDATVLARCREERDQAVQGLERHIQLLDAAKSELNLLRDQVLALQIALDDIPGRKNGTTRARSSTTYSDGSDTSSMERLLLGSAVDLDYADDGMEQVPPTIPDQSPTGSSGSQVLVDIMSNKMGKTSQDAPSVCSLSISPVSFQYQTGSNTPATTAASLPQQKASTPPATPKPMTPLPPKPSSLQHPTSILTPTPLSPRPLTTLAHLQAIMKAAHGGDDSSLAHIKAFCQLAHQTPRDQRTELHRYALMHWRKRSCSDPIPLASGGNINVEIYVDASAWGVGFVMDGQWLAWKYSDSLCISSKQIDISWAEMLAVEVGLWTVIQWATLQEQKQGQRLSLSIHVRSDNAGVVKALEKQHANYAPQQEVLQRILDLINEFDIQLTTKWISSMENLADNPSRGAPGVGATLFPYPPPVPQHLSNTLVSITSFA
ncbi:hypothetical protein AX15_005207 [Amanita polypyramis BW_CC]|nr:hypothetical protein AX15_005207 [Amanita polypyramis BW_CC]